MAQPLVRQPETYQYIETTEQLAQFAQDNHNITWLGFDTEFINEKVFYPKLCLIQVVTELGVYILDPLILPDLKPFLAMVENPDILKITHAGDNDYRLLHSLYGTYPQNLFDTQIAAGFLTFTYPISFQKLVEGEFKTTLDKSSSVTDWQARPVSRQQITYALNDVIYLPELWQRMTAQLEKLGRLSWCQEEVAKLTAADYYINDTPLDFLKSTSNTQLNRQERIFLVRLLSWRLEEAKRRNVPKEMVLPSKTMTMVAKGIAQGLGSLRQNRLISDNLFKNQSALWNQLFTAAMTDEEKALLKQMPQWQEETPEEAMSAEFLYLLVRDRAFKAGMAHTIVLSKSAFRSQNPALYTGWRRELLGDSLIGWIQSQQKVLFEVQADQCVVKFVG
jgi:ribonuclease D